ncbi:hypothetical protein JOB18_027826 [Solea senegalensis]|uniref:Uncharacterized protein n=1 Tax=Solea senegalensis TaxID=28829 RepID=A0AAV6RJH3_SOLSE|nr:hypothetical protein JOB18_027826 [Solea senegalensis]
MSWKDGNTKAKEIHPATVFEGRVSNESLIPSTLGLGLCLSLSGRELLPMRVCRFCLKVIKREKMQSGENKLARHNDGEVEG